MLTVRHVEQNGYEAVREVREVWLDPPAHSDDKPSKYDLHAQPDGAEPPLHFASGTVFVMNSAGKTVARYDLG